MKGCYSFIFVISSLMAFSLQAIADEKYATVQQLLTECKQSTLYCLGVANGVGTVLILNSSVPNSLRICTNNFISNGQMQQAFINWAEKNPQQWQEFGSIGMIYALQETWPCAKIMRLSMFIH